MKQGIVLIYFQSLPCYIIPGASLLNKYIEGMLMFRLQAFLYALLCPLLSIAHSPSFLKGRILDEDGKPLPGAHVSVDSSNKSSITDRQGWFRFDSLSPRTYTLHCTFLGYEPYNQKINPGHHTDPLKIQMKPANIELDDVKILSKTGSRQAKNASMTLKTLTRKDIQQINAGSLMESLSAQPGIHSMDIGTGISKPMIRGMSFNRVAISENGAKYEGQQWGIDHGLVIDEYSVENIEVIKGPASLLYGSDALGGVINIKPASIPGPHTFNGEVFMTAKSNNGFTGTSVEGSMRDKNVFGKVRASYQRYGDYHVPADQAIYNSYNLQLDGKLINTAGREKAITINTGLIQPWGQTRLKVSSVYDKMGFFAKAHGKELRMSDIDYERQSHDIDLPFQKVRHIKVQSNTHVSFDKNTLELTLQFQNNFRQEKNTLHDATGLRTEDLAKWQNLSVEFNKTTYSCDAQYVIKALPHHKLTIGSHLQHQNNQRAGFHFLIPGFSRITTGGYVHHNYKLNNKWRLNSGIRFDYGHIDIERYAKPVVMTGMDSLGSPEYTFTGSEISYAGGVTYTPTNRWTFKLNIGKGFRLPSVNELASNGYHHGAFRYEKGDTAISCERSYQIDMTASLEKERFKVSLTPYFNYFPNYIYITPTPEFNRDYRAGQIYKYQQNTALRMGGEIEGTYTIMKRFTVSVTGEYTYARNLDQDGYLPFTPPASVDGQLRYEFADIGSWIRGGYASVRTQYNAAQYNVVPNEKSTPSSLLFHCSFGSKIMLAGQPVKIMFQIKNLANTRYLNHLSYYRRLEIPEPGRNFQVSLKIPLNKKL